MSRWDKDRWTTYKEGDLVSWTEGSGTSKGCTQTGVVVEVFPRNVYDSESCMIWTGSEHVHYEIKSLRRLNLTEETS